MKGKKKWLIAALTVAAALATVFDLGPAGPVADALLCVVEPEACALEAM